MLDLNSTPMMDAYEVQHSPPTPWSLIWDQRHTILAMPPLTQPSIDLLQRNSVHRLTDDDDDHDHLFDTFASKESDLEAVRSNIWRTNYPLPPAQKATVENLLENAYSDFFKIDNKIHDLLGEMSYLQLKTNRHLTRMNSLRDKLIPLQEERAIRQEKVDRCLVLTSAARLLPPEILGLIFIYAKPEKMKKKGRPFPYDLCHVCFAWRQAAFALPALWNTDGFTFGRTEQGKLSFTLTPYCQNYDHGVSIQRTLYIIEPFFGVLTSLRLCDIRIEDFFALPAMSFPVLEIVELSGAGNYFTDMFHSITHVFEGADELRKLMLDFRHFPHSFFDYFPWSQITSRHYSSKYASISIDDENPRRVTAIDPDSIRGDVVTLDKLTDLRLTSNCFNTEHLSSLFSCISLPSLATCMLTSKFWNGKATKVPLFPALAPSLPTLHTITLCPTYHALEDVGKLLHECSMLSSLTFILNDEYKPPDYTSFANLIRLTLNHADSTHSPIVLGRLSQLASFNVMALCYKIDHLEALTDSFRHLILAWASDVSRSLVPNTSLSIYVHQPPRSTLSEQMVVSVLQKMLQDVKGQRTRNQIGPKVEVLREWGVVKDSWRG